MMAEPGSSTFIHGPLLTAGQAERPRLTRRSHRLPGEDCHVPGPRARAFVSAGEG